MRKTETTSRFDSVNEENKSTSCIDSVHKKNKN